MIKRNLSFIFFIIIFLGTLSAEDGANSISIDREQKSESNNLKLAKGIAAGLGAAGCVYMDAIILNWLLKKRDQSAPSNIIIRNSVDKIGLFLYKNMQIDGKTLGLKNVKLLASALLGIPTTILGLYLTKLIIDKLRSFIKDKRENKERLNE